MIGHGLLLTAIVASWASPCPCRGDDPEREIAFETVLKVFEGGPEKAGEKVIQGEREWKAFIETCTSVPVRTRLLEEKPDFDRETILVLALGDSRSILGEPYEKMAGIQRIRPSADELDVECTIIHSDHLSTEPMYPVHVVKTAKAKGFRFKKSGKFFGG